MPRKTKRLLSLVREPSKRGWKRATIDLFDHVQRPLEEHKHKARPTARPVPCTHLEGIRFSG